MTPEQQKRKLNLAVSAIMNALGLPESNRPDVRSAYVIAEDLALRQIEIIYHLPLLRHRVLEGVPLDAVAIKGKTISCIEVEFLTAPEFPPERLAAIYDKVDYANQRVKLLHPDAKIMLVLILITQLSPSDEEVFHKKLKKQIRAHAPVEVDAPIFNFEQLQHTFLNE
ncbi:MAG: hypothetical protein ABI954_02690 [Pyrinomonadaceae bacterium]